MSTRHFYKNGNFPCNFQFYANLSGYFSLKISFYRKQRCMILFRRFLMTFRKQEIVPYFIWQLLRVDFVNFLFVNFKIFRFLDEKTSLILYVSKFRNSGLRPLNILLFRPASQNLKTRIFRFDQNLRPKNDVSNPMSVITTIGISKKSWSKKESKKVGQLTLANCPILR